MKREDGEGFKKKWKPSETIQAWELLNNHGESYYHETAKPYREKHPV